LTTQYSATFKILVELWQGAKNIFTRVPHDLHKVTITSPSQILPFLYVGGKADAKNKTSLQRLGVKFIVNVTPPRSVDPVAGCPNFFDKDRSFQYLRIPIFDNKGSN